MKLSIIVLCTLLTGTIATAKTKSSVSYQNEYILWHNNKKMYWPDHSEIHTTCWNNYFRSFPKNTYYNNNDCQIMLHYINAIFEAICIQEIKNEHEASLTKNKEKLEIIKASKNNSHDNSDKSMIDMQQTAQINVLEEAIQRDENILANLPINTIPVNFPTDGTQKDKDSFKNAIANLLPCDPKDKIEEIAIIKSVLDRARKGKLYDSQ
jgi:hypothetical protein